MNNTRNYKGPFIVSFIFNIALLLMLSAIGINSTRQAEVLSDADVPAVPEVQTVSLADMAAAKPASETDVVELDEPSEADGAGDGEDLVEVTTTTPAPVTTTTNNAAAPVTTARKTNTATTKATTAKKTTTTAAPTTTTQKPTTTTTKGSGDNDSEMDWSGFH